MSISTEPAAVSVGEINSPPVQFSVAEPTSLHQLCGTDDSPVARIEKDCGVRILVRGNVVKIFGTDIAKLDAEQQIHKLLALTVGVTQANVSGETTSAGPVVVPPRVASGIGLLLPGGRRIEPRSETQAAYLRAALEHPVTFAVGPAGTGKTFLAVALALHLFREGEINRIVLTRPAVEAGERLGFLPGDMEEKVSPYLRPLSDALYSLVDSGRVRAMFESHKIEMAPLAFMRGRTLSGAAVILDEAQNTTPVQMKMFLTRMGPGSRAIVTGDLTQTDLPDGQRSGLVDALERLRALDRIAHIHFSEQDVVRHSIVRQILAAYNG